MSHYDKLRQALFVIEELAKKQVDDDVRHLLLYACGAFEHMVDVRTNMYKEEE